jgi:glycosyltransferase involved in cell wall biosynthesis
VEATQYQKEIEAYFKANPILHKSINFIFLPRTWKGYKKSRPILPMKSYSDYKKWLKNAYKIAQNYNNIINFDIVHHLRGNSAREPGYCWQLSVPYIWGPTGGTTKVPWKMFRLLNLRDCILQAARTIITDIQFRLRPRIKKAVRNASCIIAQTSYDKKQFKKVYGIDTPLIHEQAANPVIAQIRKKDEKRPLQIMWAGRCISLKGLPILLYAITDSRLKGKIILHIAGDGPQKKHWQALSKQLDIADYCIWHGWISQQNTIALMQQSDVFAFPSLLEATSTAVMEALSTGLPVICIKHCGFGDVVDESCGFSFEASDVKTAINGFKKSIISLIDNPCLLEKLSKGAIEKAKEYSWDNLATELNKIYLSSQDKYLKNN